jgi:hypothetical protein
VLAYRLQLWVQERPNAGTKPLLLLSNSNGEAGGVGLMPHGTAIQHEIDSIDPSMR